MSDLKIEELEKKIQALETRINEISWLQDNDVSKITNVILKLIGRKDLIEKDCPTCKHDDQFCMTPSTECLKCINGNKQWEDQK